jgi:hypothetical protein
MATERNILARFHKTGIVPLDPTLSLCNSNCRKICPTEAFEVPADAPDELNRCLVTRDETLQFLAEKLKRTFPHIEERLIDPLDEWE